MTESYWNRQQQQQLAPQSSSSPGLLKRPRPDHGSASNVGDLPPSHERHNYLAQNEYNGGQQPVKDTKTIDSAYERYLQNQMPSRTSGEPSAHGAIKSRMDADGRMPGLSLPDQGMMGRPRDMAPLPDQGMMGRPRDMPDIVPYDPGTGFGALPSMDAMSRPRAPLPPDASDTLYVEGIPHYSTKREVAHIFRPFVGYKEVRIVIKDSKHRGGDPLLLCFVTFMNPACAATALSALQGYKWDEDEPNSAYLRLQFSRNPGPRTAAAYRGKR